MLVLQEPSMIPTWICHRMPSPPPPFKVNYQSSADSFKISQFTESIERDQNGNLKIVSLQWSCLE